VKLCASAKSSRGVAGSSISDNTDLLKQYAIDVRTVEISKRIGVGAFGEVFMGTVLGQPVAIKTMLDVTEANMQAFRAEILLTATLRHPNIVNFVGACWGGELVCLLLEWVPGGTLGGMLQQAAAPLTWADPLLNLASDVARGIAYLHACRYFDEQDGCMKECIIHRDLKPENVLVTGYMNAKLTDFGTSRARAAEDVTMTAVGTPLFCAPEIFQGEAYNEKVDVYSFGLTLLEMATSEPLLDFIGGRWALAFGIRPNRP
jgi:serine/threonine protein kinase